MRIANRHKPPLALSILLGTATIVVIVLLRHKLAIFNPQGVVASKERNLMIFTLLLSVIVIVPVFVLTAVIVWKYRASNTRAQYKPDWDHSKFYEFVWWAVPCAIILVLAAVTWVSSHDLDPYKQLASSKKPMTIQVVALQWKWLFIYPDQHIATVNYVQIPDQTPIDFEITADAPMNSFWVPQLGGQVYAMSGMSTHLNLMADHDGTYNGSSANISGKGFAGMTFTVKSTSRADFDQWVTKVQHSTDSLGAGTYANLAKPSANEPVHYYTAPQPGLYDTIVMKYMGAH